MAAQGKPGFFETMRQGWAPAQKRGGRGSAPTPSGAPGQPRAAPARAGRGKGPARANGARRTGPARSGASPELVNRKDELSRRFAELQWDLGGIAYEMARRDHYRLEVLNAQAAKLQEVDAELGQIERMVKLDEAGAAGTCAACGAFQARGALFCWRCGKEVKTATEAPKPKPKPAKKAASRKSPTARLRRPRSARSKASKSAAPKPKGSRSSKAKGS